MICTSLRLCSDFQQQNYRRLPYEHKTFVNLTLFSVSLLRWIILTFSGLTFPRYVCTVPNQEINTELFCSHLIHLFILHSLLTDIDIILKSKVYIHDLLIMTWSPTFSFKSWTNCLLDRELANLTITLFSPNHYMGKNIFMSVKKYDHSLNVLQRSILCPRSQRGIYHPTT